ncbi:MAG: DUF559 domain-containing protein [Endomicrobiia bacterium]|nr:DUF559 domain-containing protein [Endomicrobiia bacterium]
MNENEIQAYLEKRLKETADWINNAVRSRFLAMSQACDSSSPVEKFLLVEMLIGLPEEVAIVPQKDISGLGFPCRVDFLLVLPYTKKSVIVECDGERHQKDPKAVKDDKKRDRKLLLSGIPVLRFTTDEIIYHAEDVVHELRRAIDLFDR